MFKTIVTASAVTLNIGAHCTGAKLVHVLIGTPVHTKFVSPINMLALLLTPWGRNLLLSNLNLAAIENVVHNAKFK